MKHFKMKALTAATGALLSLGIVGTAHAGAEAFSNLTITSFTINDATGRQFSTTDFSQLAIGNSGSDSASLNGTPTVSNSAGPVTGDVSLPQAIGTGSVGAPGDNTFSQVGPSSTIPTPISTPSQNFARADANLTGAIIAIGGTPNSATANQVSEITLNANNLNSNNGNASLGTGTQFTFALANPGTMTFNADAIGRTFVGQTADSAGGLSTASFNFSINIVDRATNASIFSFNPAAIGALSNVTVSGPSSAGYDISTTFAALGGNTSPTLLSNHEYTLTINSNTQAQATTVARIPEPATLALLGAGLLGMGATRRRHAA